MMPETVLEWVTIVASLLALGGWVHARLNSTATENSAKIEILSKGQEDLRQRMQAVEGELRHLPDKDGVHRLQLEMRDMRTDMARIAASSEQAARTAERLEKFLLKEG